MNNDSSRTTSNWMWLVRLLGKLTGVDRKVKWSQNKRIKVDGPSFWGVYEVFVDSELDVAFVLPKSDFSVHILTGNIIGAEHYFKYNPIGKLTSNVSLTEKAIGWKLNPGRVLLKGGALPPGQNIYLGKVIDETSFDQKITNDWIIAQVAELQKKMKSS